MADKEAEIDRGAAHEPSVRRGKPAGGGRLDGGSPSEAARDLKEQHPIKYHDLGPHHGKHHHERHEPLHGMHPKSRHGR